MKVKNIKVKKGQAAIWIILALMVLIVLLVIILIPKKPTTGVSGEMNFQGIIENCVEENVEEAVDIMIPQGGFLKPENFKKYNGVNVAFLCENIGYYKPCINQHPLILSEIRNEIYDYILPPTKNCFENAIKDYQDKGYIISAKEMNLSVELVSEAVKVNINREINIEKAENIQKFDNFEIMVKSPIYDLAKVANEIANQEAVYCYFEYLGYSLLYPKFSIRRFVFSDSTEIYTITHKETDKEMNIAIRGCAIPAGI
jgi:hypothetical protein